MEWITHDQIVASLREWVAQFERAAAEWLASFVTENADFIREMRAELATRKTRRNRRRARNDHLDVTDAERGEGVDEGVGDCGQRADVAGLPSPLDADPVGFVRHPGAGPMGHR